MKIVKTKCGYMSKQKAVELGLIKKGYNMKNRLITEENRQYDKAQKNKNRMRDSLREVGYRSPDEYADTVSQYAW